nr:MAG TPA: hypothetical protein [Caudoviricetes sp.]
MDLYSQEAIRAGAEQKNEINTLDEFLNLR